MNEYPAVEPLQGEPFDEHLWASFDWRHASVVFLMLTVIIFGDVLFSNDGMILSAKGLDLYSAEMQGLDFQFRELKKGHLALWNPHVFFGTSMISTPLYPPHVIFLLLPLPQAINTSIALHLFMTGFFMYLWTAYRKLHPLACLAAGILLMFSGPYFMHIFAGHLGNLCAMTWVPLIFLAIDGMIDRPALKWGLLGILAVTMQILTSQFQYVYYTAIAVVIYTALQLIKATNRRYIVLGLLSIPFGSVLLSAFHLLPAAFSVQEGVRSAGVTFKFAAMFSLPPENLITFLVPFFFGDMESIPYWGRCYLWEMSLFISLTGFFLLILGVIYGEKEKRRYATTVALILIFLALGAHTPFFRYLYDWLPGFKLFRGTSKFSYPACVFLVMLAAVGLDHIVHKKDLRNKTVYLIPLFTAVILGGFILGILNTTSPYFNVPVWGRFVDFISMTGESYLSPQLYRDGQFVRFVADFSIRQLFISTVLCIFLALLFYLLRYSQKIVYIILAVALVELLVFAAYNRPTFDYREPSISDFKKFHESHPGDYRVLNLVKPNITMSAGGSNIWGYWPIAMGRYVQFMAFTQDADPDIASTNLSIHRYDRLFSMLRLRYAFAQESNNMAVYEFDDLIPRISLINHWKMAEARSDIFKEMRSKTFDPHKMVILEKTPNPLPLSSNQPGACSILDSGSDHYTIKAYLPSPALLLLSENYSQGWRIIPIKQGLQEKYDIMPANYTLMAIPLAAGEHLLKMVYLPSAFIIGKWISIISFILYFLCGFFVWLKGVKKVQIGKNEVES